MDPRWWLGGLVVKTLWLGLYTVGSPIVGFKNKIYMYI